MLHDLFADDEGGSPQDASLLDRPAMENPRRQSPDRHRDPDVDRLRQLALCFFTANVRNPSTRRAYMRGRAGRFFAWCDDRGLTLPPIRPHDVATYMETLQQALRRRV